MSRGARTPPEVASESKSLRRVHKGARKRRAGGQIRPWKVAGTKRGKLRDMVALEARGENGRIRLDEPTDLPDGKEVSVALLDDDGLTEADREKLLRMID